MQKQRLPAAILLAAVLPLAAARAQERDAPKVEVGVQFTSLSVRPPEFFFATEHQPGFGGRVTYNFNDYFAVEAEANYFPVGTFRTFSNGGNIGQAQFGVKVGRRFNRFGLFAKARPGFVSNSTVSVVEEVQRTRPDGTVVSDVEFDIERKTHFSLDVGGVVEFYPSRRVVVRFDAGDTIVRYGAHQEPGFFFPPPPGSRAVVTAPPEVRHNFQFGAGVGFRFGGGSGPAEDGSAPDSSGVGRRFEVGVQFTSLLLRTPRTAFVFQGQLSLGLEEMTTELGFGGRVGYNLLDWLAVEAEANFYPRRILRADIFARPSPAGGYPTQAQFGIKAGRRFQRFGLFGKARPGFVTFSEVSQIVGTFTFVFEGQPIIIPITEDRRKTYFSVDVGGVVEFYPSRRVFTRFDIGDTVIRYSRRQHVIFLPGPAPTRLATEHQHNFQFSAGVGFRF